ncbi:hypothetical protein [Gemmobacter sp.]|uniref:hypothetical protein n=1 Tax=Gemmobacter sp. TaxID=1898957 RepID=UPI002AFE5B6E|nr:hypothetical protein [Gemmobacter sp.]
MANARALLRRVQKVEQARLPRPRLSPLVTAYGSFTAFEAECMAKIAANKLDRDFEGVLAAFRRWEADALWRFQ